MCVITSFGLHFGIFLCAYFKDSVRSVLVVSKIPDEEVIKSHGPGCVFENNYRLPGSFSIDPGVGPAVGCVGVFPPGAATSRLHARVGEGQQRGDRSGRLRCDAECLHRSVGGQGLGGGCWGRWVATRIGQEFNWLSPHCVQLPQSIGVGVTARAGRERPSHEIL